MPDYSDIGDSDMDEATYSDSQDHHIPKKAPFNLNLGFYFFFPLNKTNNNKCIIEQNNLLWTEYIILERKIVYV